VELDGVNFYYMGITGPGTDYHIPNSIDLGGSYGWQFNPPVSFADRLYWVGKDGTVSGNTHWDNPDNWSTVKGSNENPCRFTPINVTTVIFDEYSFDADEQVVTLNVPAVCDSMLWDTPFKPVFDMTDKDLTLDGSLEMQSGMSVLSTGGSIIFNLNELNGRTQETITTGNIHIPRPVIFDHPACQWILKDSLKLTDGTTDYNLTLTNGSLTLDKYLKCGTFSTGNHASVRLNISNATVEVTNWNYSQSNHPALTATAGSIIRVADNFTGKNGDTYNVVEAGAGTLTTVNGTADFKKIIMNKNNGRLGIDGKNLSTDTLILDYIGNSPGVTRYNIVTSGDLYAITIGKYFGNTGITGTCSKTIELSAITAGGALSSMAANIIMTTTPTPAVVELDNLHTYSVNITGATPYSIQNYINLGSSSGWTPAPPAYKGRLYWVGGTGNWTDVNHWVTESGAPACHYPSAENTVVFNENSGLTYNATVSLNTAHSNAVCDSMLWLGGSNPIFNMNSCNLIIHGSLELKEGMILKNEFGAITFKSSREKEYIRTHNVAIPAIMEE